MSEKLVCPQCQCELETAMIASGTSQEIRCSSCGAVLSWDAGRKVVRKGEGSVAPVDATQLEARREMSIMSAKTAIDPRARRSWKAGVSTSTPPEPGAAESGGEDSAVAEDVGGAEEGSGSAPAESVAEAKRISPSGSPPGGSEGPPDPKHSLVGRTIGGCEILEWIGRGGMGAVYRARQISLDRLVAFKVIGENIEKDESLLRRFEREAKTIAKFNSSRIVGVHEVGFDQGIHFIFMEYVPGGDLKSLTRKRGRLDAEEALRYVRQAAEGLLAAEKQKIIHRDLKPENLMLDANGEVKITDFGLAKTLLAADLTLTQMGDYLGTPIYMSPEQAQGITLDHRSDMYSLGATCFFLMTGTPPYEGATIYEILRKKAEHDFLDPRSALEGQVPDGICKIIRRMTALQPRDRYESFADLVVDIDRYFLGKAPRPPARPVPLVAAAVGAAVLAVAGGAVFWYLQLRVSLTTVAPGYSSPQGGVAFILNGSNFPSARSEISLRFGDQPVVEFTVKSGRQIEGRVPPAAGTGAVDISLATTWSSARMEKGFEYREIAPRPAPTLSGVEPTMTSSLEGGVVFALRGKNFPEKREGVTIHFGENRVEEFAIKDSNTITGLVPRSKVWGRVSVHLSTPDGSASFPFSYSQPNSPGQLVSEEDVRKRIEILKSQLKDCEKADVVFQEVSQLLPKVAPGTEERRVLDSAFKDLRTLTKARETIFSAAPLVSAVPADDLAQSWKGLKERKELLEKILSTENVETAEIRACLEGESGKRRGELEKRARDVCEAFLQQTELAREGFGKWEAAAAEEFPRRVGELKAGKQKLLEFFPASLERIEAVAPRAKLEQFEQEIARRMEVGKAQQGLLGLLAKVEGQLGAIDRIESWTGDPGNAARGSLEEARKALEAQKADPRAPLAEQTRRLEALDLRVKKWNDHRAFYEQALEKLAQRSLDDPVFEKLTQDGLADRGAERLDRARRGMAEGFRLLVESLDSGGAKGAFEASKEALKGLQGADSTAPSGGAGREGTAWADGCLERIRRLEALLAGMAPVPAGKVKTPDDRELQKVAGFFIDQCEVSVDDFRRFLEEFRLKPAEELRAIFPELKGLDPAALQDCFSEPRYLNEPPAPNGNWPIEAVTYHQARAYCRWKGKDLFTRPEWWLAARGDVEKGPQDFPCLFEHIKRSGEYPEAVDTGCNAFRFGSRTPVHHLSGNVAEWVRAAPDAAMAQLIGGSYKDREKREKFSGDVPDNRELRRSLRGYGFRGVLRPREFFGDLIPR